MLIIAVFPGQSSKVHRPRRAPSEIGTGNLSIQSKHLNPLRHSPHYTHVQIMYSNYEVQTNLSQHTHTKAKNSVTVLILKITLNIHLVLESTDCA